MARFLDAIRGWLGRPLNPEVSEIPPEAVAANGRANGASEAGDLEAAERGYLEATRLAPGWSSPWFNLGLLHKNLGRWRESLEANQKALSLLADARGAAAAWNLGIAATALGEWAEARRAWRAFGIALPEGEGPIDADFGPVPVRVGLPDAPEVVWCNRLDPARAVIESIPMPESGRRRGDLVLHDGEPKGYRMLGDRERAVFDELQLLAPSRESTFTVDVRVPSPEDSAALIAAFETAGMTAEDWTTHVNFLCRACSEGRPHEQHDHGRGEERPWKAEHIIGIAATGDARITEVLERWRLAAQGRSFERPVLALSGEAP